MNFATQNLQSAIREPKMAEWVSLYYSILNAEDRPLQSQTFVYWYFGY